MLPVKLFTRAILALLLASFFMQHHDHCHHQRQYIGVVYAHSFTSAKRNMGAFMANNPPRSRDNKPYFDEASLSSGRNVTAIVGSTAELGCHVKNLGNRTISWIRQRDLHILTSSVYTYTGDNRFSVSHPETSDEWTLKISRAHQRDVGIYECQINTEPKLNLAFALRVEDINPVPAATAPNRKNRRIFDHSAAQAIISPPDVHVKKGSTISLLCIVNVQSSPPSSISWLHGTSLLDFDSPRGGISLETEKTENGTTSRLMMTQARLSDSGNYTCVPSNANPATVTVHVLNGEHPAAMQHGGTADNRTLSLVLLFAVVALIDRYYSLAT